MCFERNVFGTLYGECEPIVNTPEDAIKCFLGTELDVLCIGPYIIEKSQLDVTSSKTYYENFELD